MVSKWFLGAVSAAGLAAGFSVTAYASSTPKAHTTGSAEVEKLYHTELALGNREQELQFLLKLRSEQVTATARPASAATPEVAAAPSRPPATPAAAQPSQRIIPATTTTIAEAPAPTEPEQTPTTVTLPPSTSTTAVAPTTTTTQPGSSDDSGGGVDH